MTALPLYPVEPPDNDDADLLALVRRARLCRAGADVQLERAMAQLRVEPLEPTTRLFLDVERLTAEHRLLLWGQVTTVLEAQARTVGLEP